ncbi:putative conserved membrane protein [Mycobacteroides abscessus subsp. abscessus]|nr:putative conserved membrane protein [Mycobacteroides abscessus subsp. abscessus]
MNQPSRANPAQARALLTVAFGPSAVALVIIAAIVLVQLVIANSDMTGTFGAVASMWLGTHLVPISIGGRVIEVLPLLPTAAMVWGVARTVASALAPTTSWYVIRWVIASALAGPLLMTAISLAIIHDASTVLTQLQSPNALRAFGCVLGVHSVGAVIGVVMRVGRRIALVLQLPSWPMDAARGAVAGVLALFGLSGAVTAGSLVVHWATMDQLYSVTNDFVGQLSLTLLAILYAPNVILGSCALAVGSSAHVGTATFSAFAVFGGQLPAVPILAAVPTPPLGPAWVALMIIGAASGVAVGQQCARHPVPWPTAIHKVVTAALLAATFLAVVGKLAGGQLGNFGRLGIDQGTFGPGVFFWFLVIGLLTVFMLGGATRLPARTRRDPEPAPEPHPEPTPEPDPEPASESEMEAEPEPDPGPQRDPEPAPEPEADPNEGPEIDPSDPPESAK